MPDEVNTGESLVWYAKRILESMVGAGNYLERELKKVEKRPFGMQQRKADLEAKIKIRGMYLKRLGSFQPQTGTEFKCPRCWMLDETAATLNVLKSGRTFAKLHCWRCQQSFEV